jgi:hypothetical protein
MGGGASLSRTMYPWISSRGTNLNTVSLLLSLQQHYSLHDNHKDVTPSSSDKEKKKKKKKNV